MRMLQDEDDLELDSSYHLNLTDPSADDISMASVLNVSVAMDNPLNLTMD